MLEPAELARAMGFSDEDAAYEFAGNKTEVTKQIGNAVPVNQACALVLALFSV
jgi:DNA (cytosine-5)-methyltransferase 1